MGVEVGSYWRKKAYPKTIIRVIDIKRTYHEIDTSLYTAVIIAIVDDPVVEHVGMKLELPERYFSLVYEPYPKAKGILVDKLLHKKEAKNVYRIVNSA